MNHITSFIEERTKYLSHAIEYIVSHPEEGDVRTAIENELRLDLFEACKRGRNDAVDYIEKAVSEPYLRPQSAIFEEARLINSYNTNTALGEITK